MKKYSIIIIVFGCATGIISLVGTIINLWLVVLIVYYKLLLKLILLIIIIIIILTFFIFYYKKTQKYIKQNSKANKSLKN